MKFPPKHPLCGLLAAIHFGALMGAQTPAETLAPEPQREAAEGAVIELSPFVVSATPDDSYGVLNSTSIVSFQVELEKLPMSADVFTQAFREDTASETLEAMLQEYSAGSGIGSASGDVGGIPVLNPMDRAGGTSVSAGVQLRGLGAAVMKIDGFMVPAPAGTGLNSLFGTERIEVINGPQSLLYGNGGGGGVINIIPLQARIGSRDRGELKFRLDEYGHEMVQLEYRISRERAAAVVAFMHQYKGDRRDWIGGPLESAYGQISLQLGRRTLLRATGLYTDFNRIIPSTAVMDQLGGRAFDSRHGQRLRYLLATDQIESSATGPSGAGVLLNGNVTWDNVDSYAGAFREEISSTRLGSIVVESFWRPGLTTQLSIGGWNKDSMLGYGSGVRFYAPDAPRNPIPGEWTAASDGSNGRALSKQPSDSQAFRFSVLLTNDLFGGRAYSRTIFGVERILTRFANLSYAYFEVGPDGDFLRDDNGVRFPFRLDERDGPVPFWSVSDGPVRHPWFPTGADFINYDGKNYRLGVNKEIDPGLISPANPQGFVDHPDNTETYINSKAISGGIFAVNFTEWMDGRLTTLAGVRYVDARNEQLPSQATPQLVAGAQRLSFSVGANYELTSWLRPYFTVSDTYNLPQMVLTVPRDPFGEAARVAHSIGGELGLKIGRGNKLSGSASVYAVNSKNEPYEITTNMRADINPLGINGRHGTTGPIISVDRKSEGAQLLLTATPNRSWRFRLAAAWVSGTIGSDTAYPVVYNDQFHTNSAGQVTYANGTVVHVLATGSGSNIPRTAEQGVGWVPLTIEMLSDPNGNYYVSPNPVSGAFTTADGKRGRNILNSSSGGVLDNGPIRTGITGLPISQFQPQIAGFKPLEEIVTTRAGERVGGFPQFSANFSAMYTARVGALRGLRLGGSLRAESKRGDFYFYPEGYGRDAERQLMSWPSRVEVNAVVGFQRRIGRVVWDMQLNVSNLFDEYQIFIRPHPTLGYAGQMNAFYVGQPRYWTWTNTFKF
jgi:outer membrane receptor protein involved in Fe transport